jgi:hypothetical protein
LNRIAQKVLDKSLDELFGEQNDLVVGLSSMKRVRLGAYPKLQVEVLPCNHFQYFQSPEGKKAIRRWPSS